MSDAERVASWIAGLMRENYEAVGFIPEPCVADRYVAHARYVLQADEAGRRVGYLLHGALRYGRTLSIAQHCIQIDRRRHGYGENALAELVRRAEYIGASCITARVATDLDAVDFWLSQGFEIREVVPGGSKRQRSIARIWLPLALPMFAAMTTTAPVAAPGRPAPLDGHKEAASA
jgi:GNAT superfamily N-acetyltransferase